MENNEIDILEAVSNKTRLRILLLSNGVSLSVKCMVETLKLPQPTVSRHLSILRKSGLLQKRESGVKCYYTQSYDGKYRFLKQKLTSVFQKELADQEPYASDRKRLAKLLPVFGEDCELLE